jgi:hypothetical protein
MSKTITAKQIQSFIKGDPKRHPIGDGLYLGHLNYNS